MRSPSGAPTTASARNAMSAVRISPTGSACATLPPRVERARIWGDATQAPASARSGTDATRSGSRATCSRVTIAPATTAAPSRRTAVSPAMALRSTTRAGRTRRWFSSPINVCPPASATASGVASSATASSTLAGRTKENAGGFMAGLCVHEAVAFAS